MKRKTAISALGCALIALWFLNTNGTSPTVIGSEMQEKDKTQLSEGESKAASAISEAPDVAAKLTAAAAFVKKYPKSSARMQIAEYVAGQIGQLKDQAQKLQLAEESKKVFTAEQEVMAIEEVVLDSYAVSYRVDEAFTLGTTMLAKNPDNLHILVQLAMTGANAAKQQNPKYIPQSIQYGKKAIEMIEANNKPAKMTDASWAFHKEMLPQLYQQTAVLALFSGDKAEGKTRIEKAVALSPNDPFNYVVIGSLVNDEYQEVAKSYQALPAGAQKDEALKKANDLIDKMIDLYAHAVGLSTGRPEYQQLQTQVLQDLTASYKYRHKSLEGLQELIDKYKSPAKPQ
jgi:hypothetical protein